MKKVTIISIFVSLLLILGLSVPASAAQITDLPERIDGKDRFAVAVNISQKWGKADTVILANYLAFADALTATPLAFKLNAPILLTQPNTLTEETKKQIQTLGAKNVVIVGGTGSISEQVVSDITSLGISNIKRIAGKDRFEVSKNLAKQIGLNGTAVIANGLVFADALSIAPYAAANAYPILLTRNNKLPPGIQKVLAAGTITKSIVVGGEASVSKGIFKQLPGASRIGGKDRYEVGANIANTYGQNRSKHYLATGLTFADALTGSVLAAKENAVILLTNTDRIPDSTLGILSKKNVPVTILGGVGSVKDQIVHKLTTITPSSRPILYIVPHQDDEILSYGVDIRNELSRGRQVHVVLLTRGDDSAAKEVLNGVYYCHIHNKNHNPAREGFKHGSLSPDEFSNARTDEYNRALRSLGVPQSNIHTDFVPNNQYYGTTVRPIIEKYLAAYPNADVRTFSSVDGHSAHALLGRVVNGMYTDGVLQRYQAKYFISIYTDRFSTIPKPMPTIKNVIEKQSDIQFLRSAIGEYRRWDPVKGHYAAGYHSVQSQFDALWNNPFVNSHY